VINNRAYLLQLLKSAVGPERRLLPAPTWSRLGVKQTPLEVARMTRVTQFVTSAPQVAALQKGLPDHLTCSFFFSGFLCTLFQFRKRAASKASKFGGGGVEFLGVVGAARLECAEPAAESRELIRRKLGDGLGDFFNFHSITSSAMESSPGGTSKRTSRERRKSVAADPRRTRVMSRIWRLAALGSARIY
jgi:hypothetical protein